MHDTRQRLVRYKAWADDELLTALARLDGGSPVVGLAIKALSHVHVVDEIFAAHLRRQAHGHASANLNEAPSLADLSADIRRSDRAYLDYVAALESMIGARISAVGVGAERDETIALHDLVTG